ncbi:MAG: hypothetical protein K2W91_12845, partial [Novosphingobium sp.]|nr:hypothetical protein [Novosphingobium sp.]
APARKVGAFSLGGDRMPRQALVLGYGQIGRAVAANLAADGWLVTIGRSSQSLPQEFSFSWASLDRGDAGQLAAIVGERFDAIVDTIAFDAGHGAQWQQLAGRFGKLVVISSMSVYRDAQGRSLDEAATNGAPEFPVPICEDQPRVDSGPATYSSRKAALEDAVMQLDQPFAIARAGAVYGLGSRAPREWWFVQRMLAGNGAIPVAWNGASRFHPVAAENLAEMIRIAITSPGNQIFNACDAECPTVVELGEAIRAAMGSSTELELFDGPPRGLEGYTPWSVRFPLVADTATIEHLGYRPVTSYAQAMPAVCRDIEDRARTQGWRAAFPGLSAYPSGFFLDL